MFVIPLIIKIQKFHKNIKIKSKTNVFLSFIKWLLKCKDQDKNYLDINYLGRARTILLTARSNNLEVKSYNFQQEDVGSNPCKLINKRKFICHVNKILNYFGAVRLSKLQYAKKLSELFKFVADKASNDDKPKNSSYFDVLHISYTVKKRWMWDVLNEKVLKRR